MDDSAFNAARAGTLLDGGSVGGGRGGGGVDDSTFDATDTVSLVGGGTLLDGGVGGGGGDTSHTADASILNFDITSIVHEDHDVSTPPSGSPPRREVGKARGNVCLSELMRDIEHLAATLAEERPQLALQLLGSV